MIFKTIRLFSNNPPPILYQFVPPHQPVLEHDIKLLENFIYNSRNMLILTGAGISTESGIPDYRSEKVGLYARSNRRPVLHQEFLKSPAIRQRYWARNFVGWDRFSECLPNSTHKSIRNLELELRKTPLVVTQNVDSLHFKAGSRNVVELHGSAFTVRCLDCNVTFPRPLIQEQMIKLNPNMNETVQMIRPDADVEIPEDSVKNFKTPDCEMCGGILKPDIIFFGDNVPKTRVDRIKTAISESDSLLILGSSLSTFSSFRIVLQAIEEEKRIAIVNIGPTRADKYIELKISAKCGDLREFSAR